MLSIISCKNDDVISPNNCKQCNQIVTDSATGDTIRFIFRNREECDRSLQIIEETWKPSKHNATLFYKMYSNGEISVVTDTAFAP